jgi:ribose transport system substrate-binding protein
MGAGCQPARPQKTTVALVVKSLANEFFVTMENAARRHCETNGEPYELVVNGIKDELDVARQIDLVEQMIAKQVSAIVIAPADSKALVPVCKKAMSAGIVVVNIDNKLDTAVLADKRVRIPFVGPDNRKGARLAGRYLARRLSPGDGVAIVEGAPNALNAVERKLGFEEAMNEAGMKVISSQCGFWETDKSDQIVAALLTEHPSIKAILCANDSMALGVVSALRGSGRQDKVLIVGYDNISAARKLLKEGKMLATADQHPGAIAVAGIERALAMMDRKTAQEDLETPVELVTAETLAKSID